MTLLEEVQALYEAKTPKEEKIEEGAQLNENWHFQKSNDGLSYLPTIEFEKDGITFFIGCDEKKTWFAYVYSEETDLKEYIKNGFRKQDEFSLEMNNVHLKKVLEVLKKTFGVSPSEKDLQPLIMFAVMN